MKTVDEFLPKEIFTRHYPTLESASAGVVTASAELRELLTSLPPETLHASPEGDKWSPAQVADHLILTTGFFAEAVEQALAADGPPVEMSRGQLTEAGTAVAPPEGQPRSGRELAELTGDLERTASEIIAAVERAEKASRLDEICLIHSFFGEMNALECLQLAAWHIERHRRAVEKSLVTDGGQVGSSSQAGSSS